MTDARLPERFLVDRRLLSLPDPMYRAYVTALLFSVANRTDGFIAKEDIDLMPRFAKQAPTALVKGGLWSAAEGGWMIVDFLGTQTTRDELEVLENARRRDREKKQRQRSRPRDFEPVPEEVPGDVSPGQHRQAGRQGQEQVDESTGEVDAPWPPVRIPGSGGYTSVPAAGTEEYHCAVCGGPLPCVKSDKRHEAARAA